MTMTTRKQDMRTFGKIAPLGVAVALALAACAGPDDNSAAEARSADTTIEESAEKSSGKSPADQDTGAGHGEIDGAREVAEPQLHLVSVDRRGAVGMVDLLGGTDSRLGEIAPPSAVTSDGRYLFAATAGGVEIVDSGVWTWDHKDHFHYYRSNPRVLDPVAGDSRAIVTTSGNATSGGTGLFFPGSGEAVLLSNQALSEGRTEEVFRVKTDPHQGLTAPLGSGALVTAVDESGNVTGIRFHDADGAPVDGATAPCPGARDAITTHVGVVVGCADGAVLAGVDGDDPHFEHIPYPDGTQAPPATDFRNRKGRASVAAPAGDAGFWLLDTRERQWKFVPTEQPLVQVTAVDDEDSHVVALDNRGRIRVYDGEAGTEIAATEAVLADAVSRPDALAGVELTVDRERAYVNDPVAGVVHEIDYRGAARIARTLDTPTAPDFLAETGR